MPFKDNRTYVQALARTGDAVLIKTVVDWDLEAAAITGRSCETMGPACFFEKLVDYPEKGRLLGAPLASYRRLATALGMSPQAATGDIFAEYEQRISKPIKPVVVRDGPCKENKLFGEEVDLSQFPVPVVHEGDGGRYIGTWDCVINKDPESQWTNWGMYRLMVYSKNMITGGLQPHSHWGIIHEKYRKAGKTMPLAVALGADPLIGLTAASPHRIGDSEADFAAALAQEPIELVKCETIDILVPAHAEIILEGEISPGMGLPEGPFGEFPGYRTQGWTLQPVFIVKAITYRSNPIICLTPEGVGFSDGKIGPSMAGAIGIKQRLKSHGIPVIDVNCPPEMGAIVAVISVKRCDSRILSQIAGVVHGRRTAMPKIIVVDEDIDVFDIKEVMHAFGTRLHPVHGVSSNTDRTGWTLVPYLTPEERAKARLSTGIYDCTWPSDWTGESDIPQRMSFKNAYPEGIQNKVIRSWKDYGF